MVLNSDGYINIWNRITGFFERRLAFERYYHVFGLREILKDHSEYFKNIHNYTSFKEHSAKNISKLHTILEYNHRFEENLINYFFQVIINIFLK